MKPLSRGIACTCTLLVIASVSRCGPGQRYLSARKAEERGDIHVAYDLYCQAARNRAGNGAVAAGIKRTSAAAAAHWEVQARAAIVDGHRADAWRMWMRVLDIRPDHPTAARKIRRIEERQDSAVSAARNEWLRLGSTALVLAPPTVPLLDREASEPPPILVSARPADEDSPPDESIASDDEALTSLANASADQIEGMLGVSPRSDTIAQAPVLALAAATEMEHPRDAVFNPREAGSSADVTPAALTAADDSPESVVAEPKLPEPEPPDLDARDDPAGVGVAIGAEGVEPAGMLATVGTPDDGSFPVDAHVFTRPRGPGPAMTDATPQDVETSGNVTRIAMAEGRDEAQAAASEDEVLVFGPSPQPPAETGYAEAASVEPEIGLPQTAQTIESIEEPPASGELPETEGADEQSRDREGAVGARERGPLAYARGSDLAPQAQVKVLDETLRDRDVAEPIGDARADSPEPTNTRAQAVKLPTMVVGTESTRHKPDDQSDRAQEASVAGRLPVVRVGPDAADLLPEQVAVVTKRQRGAKELPVVPVDQGPAVGKADDEDRSADDTSSAQTRSAQRLPVAQRAPDPGPGLRVDAPSAPSSGDIPRHAQDQTGAGVFISKAAPGSDKASPSSTLREPTDPKPRPRLGATGSSLPVRSEAARRPAERDRSGEKPRTVWRLQERSARRGEFLNVQTLSKKDPRYSRRANLVEDISARLRDTDGDLDADLDVYDGDRRIKKIRELPVGRSQTFRSLSGTRYRLTILGVHHKTRTVRIGIKSAR